MNASNKALLETLINDRLKKAIDSETKDTERKQSFEEAMNAIEQQTRMNDVTDSHDRETSNDRIFKWVELAATIVLVPIIDIVGKRAFARDICNFEKDYTFTTSAGRSLGNLFHFKK